MKQLIFLHPLIKTVQPVLMLALCLVLLCSTLAKANNWEASIYKSALPQKIIAVDKSNQLFHYFEDINPTGLKYTFDCTTGQSDGDKQVANDLKTPEGVYFVQYKITEGLDFIKYGGIAYTLNYPNPVDRLRGKTGYGIWIHSKGLGIKPNDTEGCIAIGLKELISMGPKLSYGTAVLLAETIKVKNLPKPNFKTASSLINKMDEWTKAWAARSNTMFTMYNQNAYTKAMPQSFKAFKANKVNLFSFLPWINIVNKQIHVLEGPGYWVTWSEQFYRAPNLSTEGIRRLYWQLNKKNEYKIVGMEWMPRNLGMKAAYLNGTLVASTLGSKTALKSSEDPELPALDMPEQGKMTKVTVADAKMADALAKAKIAAAKMADAKLANAKLAEAKLANAKLAEAKVAEAKVAEALAKAKMAEAKLADAKLAESLAKAKMEKSHVLAPKTEQVQLNDEVQTLLRDKMAAWLNSWQVRSNKFFTYYDRVNFGKIADIDNKNTDNANYNSFARLKNDMQQYFKAKWIEIIPRSITFGKNNNYLYTQSELFIRAHNQTSVQGILRLYWKKASNGEYLIVDSSWLDKNLDMEIDYIKKVTPVVDSFIAAWQKAWLNADVDAYAKFYASDATQQNLSNKASIIRNKKRIWKNSKPEQVKLSQFHILLSPDGLIVGMTQNYKNSKGYSDVGTKTLLLIPNDNGYLIIEEKWDSLTN